MYVVAVGSTNFLAPITILGHGTGQTIKRCFCFWVSSRLREPELLSSVQCSLSTESCSYFDEERIHMASWYGGRIDVGKVQIHMHDLTNSLSKKPINNQLMMHRIAWGYTEGNAAAVVAAVATFVAAYLVAAYLAVAFFSYLYSILAIIQLSIALLLNEMILLIKRITHANSSQWKYSSNTFLWPESIVIKITNSIGNAQQSVFPVYGSELPANWNLSWKRPNEATKIPSANVLRPWQSKLVVRSNICH